MSKGGRRIGAGRPAGSRNKRTVAQAQAIETSGLTPLDYLVAVYQNEKMPERMRLEAAKIAAPFVHPRLSAVDMDLRGEYRDVEELSDQELTEIIRAFIATTDQELETVGRINRSKVA